MLTPHHMHLYYEEMAMPSVRGLLNSMKIMHVQAPKTSLCSRLETSLTSYPPAQYYCHVQHQANVFLFLLLPPFLPRLDRWKSSWWLIWKTISVLAHYLGGRRGRRRKILWKRSNIQSVHAWINMKFPQTVIKYSFLRVCSQALVYWFCGLMV